MQIINIKKYDFIERAYFQLYNIVHATLWKHCSWKKSVHQEIYNDRVKTIHCWVKLLRLIYWKLRCIQWSMQLRGSLTQKEKSFQKIFYVTLQIFQSYRSNFSIFEFWKKLRLVLEFPFFQFFTKKSNFLMKKLDYF